MLGRICGRAALPHSGVSAMPFRPIAGADVAACARDPYPRIRFRAHYHYPHTEFSKFQVALPHCGIEGRRH